ncbi:unnamed protein product, partial [Polarella glacialis]
MTMTTSATQFTKESECAAEGVGSILKFLASTSNLSPARVVGKTLMKFYGLAGDGSDDQFLERVWRSMGKCSFNFAHARARQCRYRLGHGSKTLHRMLKASAARKASEQLAQRRLPWAGKDLEVLKPLVQMMDSQLFLVKHLLLLREQVAAFECDLVVSEKFFNFAGVWEALNLKLPNGLLGILKPTVYHSQVDSKKDIEAELKGACESLITNLTAHITQPLGVLNTQIGDFLAVPGVDRSKLREQTFMQPDQLRDTIGGFLANVRGRVPFAASHIRLYLSGGSDASGIDDGSGRSRAGAQQSTSPILFKPVQIRLVDSWGRLEGLLEEQSFSAEELEA